MIHYIYADALDAFPVLKRTMFEDRADQFKKRLDWEVTVDDAGQERDEYDAMNPMYIIWKGADGTHGGSMRVLPTVGQCMTNDHFVHLAGGVRIESPLVWECTRFCLSPRHTNQAAEIAGSLMLAGCQMGLRFGLDSSVGVFDPRMVRIYRRIGWEPEVLGTDGEGRDRISLGLWDINETARNEMCERLGIDTAVPDTWLDASFPVTEELLAA